MTDVTPPDRDKDGKWLSGSSGNPSGRKRGEGWWISENRELIKEKLPQMIDVGIERALHGDADFAKLLVNKILPNAKYAHIKIEGIDYLKDCSQKEALRANSEVLHAVVSGDLPIEEGEAVARLIERHHNMLAAERLEEINDKLNKLTQHLKIDE